MRRSRLPLTLAVIVLGVVALFASAVSSATAAPPLVFGDEFTSGPLDTSAWTVRTPWNTRYTTGELEYYDPADVTFTNGGMRLTSEKRSVNGYGYTSGIVTSLPQGKFGYGYFEMRAKLPKGQGIWPAFWLTNDDNNEIDIFELLGHDPTTLYMTYHRDHNEVYQSIYRGPDFSAGYHTFAVDWQPSYIRWYVDGVKRGEYTGPVRPDPMWIVANTAVGGAWPGSPDATTVFPQHYDIDYIRAYDSRPLVAGPGVVQAAFTNSVAYELRSLLTTRFKVRVDQDDTWSKLVVDGARSDGGDLVLYDGPTGPADTDLDLRTWDGTNERGDRARYSGNYTWTLTVSKGGASTVKTGNVTVSRILFNISGTSQNGQANTHTGYMIPGSANLYTQAGTSAYSDSLRIDVTGPYGYSGSVGPFGFSADSPLNATGRLTGGQEVDARAINTLTVTGSTDAAYTITVLQ